MALPQQGRRVGTVGRRPGTGQPRGETARIDPGTSQRVSDFAAGPYVTARAGPQDQVPLAPPFTLIAVRAANWTVPAIFPRAEDLTADRADNETLPDGLARPAMLGFPFAASFALPAIWSPILSPVAIAATNATFGNILVGALTMAETRPASAVVPEMAALPEAWMDDFPERCACPDGVARPPMDALATADN
jgi:hypothetical protein